MLANDQRNGIVALKAPCDEKFYSNAKRRSNTPGFASVVLPPSFRRRVSVSFFHLEKRMTNSFDNVVQGFGQLVKFRSRWTLPNTVQQLSNYHKGHHVLKLLGCYRP